MKKLTQEVIMFRGLGRFLRFLLLPFLVTMLIASATSALFGGGQQYVEKNYIKSELFNMVSNGGDLRSIKNAYENRRFIEGAFSRFFNKGVEYYEYTVPMSKVLEDIRSDYYSKSKDIEFSKEFTGRFDVGYINSSDAESIAKLDIVIKENEELNPFEGLDINQRDNFENIRIKLGDRYALVSGDLEKLSSDIRVKNELVGQYLKDSTVSFWVSIFALFFSLIVSAYQFYIGRDGRIKSLLAEVINER